MDKLYNDLKRADTKTTELRLILHKMRQKVLVLPKLNKCQYSLTKKCI